MNKGGNGRGIVGGMGLIFGLIGSNSGLISGDPEYILILLKFNLNLCPNVELTC